MAAGNRLRTDAIKKRAIELKERYPRMAITVIAERLGHPYSFIQKTLAEHKKKEEEVI